MFSYTGALAHCFPTLGVTSAGMTSVGKTVSQGPCTYAAVDSLCFALQDTLGSEVDTYDAYDTAL